MVEPLEAEEKTKGGILLPTAPARSRSVAASSLLAAGKVLDDGKRQAMTVVIGDEVLYGRYAGNDVGNRRQGTQIMRESDILAKIAK